MISAEEEFQKKFEVLRLSYIAKLDDRLKVIEAQAAVLTGSSGDKTAALNEILQEAHKLAGNAATFGFKELGSDAATLEQLCDSILNNAAAGDEDYVNLAAGVYRLRDQLGD